MSAEWKLFLATGLLGGFTTFSAFSLETLSMICPEHHLYAFVYVALSIMIGLLATIVGLIALKMFWG